MFSSSALSSILVTIAYAAACLGAGIGVARLFRNDTREEWDGITLATHFLLGSLVIGAVLVIIGLAGWLRAGPIVVLLTLGGAGLYPARRRFATAPAALRAWWRSWRAESRAVQWLALATALMAVGFGAAALVRPPIGDAEAFYVAYAKIMAAAGRLEPMSGTYASFSTIGLPAELHFAALMILGDSHAAKLYIWPIALAAAAFLAGIAGLCGAGRTGRALSLAILFSSATFTHYITDGKVDLVAAAFGLAAFYWAMAKNGAFPGMALTGLFAGAATVAKFSYLPTLGPALTVLLAWRFFWETPPEERRAVQLMPLLLCACVAWLPQLAKNAMLFGAPLAPFVGGPRDGDWLNQVWFPPEVTLRIVLTYPFALVFGRYPMQGGGLSPLMIAFAPLVLLMPRVFSRASPLAKVTVAAMAGTAIWVALRPSIIAPRYILATLLLFVPLVARAAETAWENAHASALLRGGMSATVLAAFAVASYHLLPIPGALAAYLAGRLSPCALASEYCEPLQALDRVAAPGDRVFLAGYYGFWLRPDLLQCRDLPAEQRAVQASHDTTTALREMGFRFAVVDNASHAWLAERLAGGLGTQGDGAERLAQNANVSVYALPPSPGAQEMSRCSEVRPGEWKLVQRAADTAAGRRQ